MTTDLATYRRALIAEAHLALLDRRLAHARLLFAKALRCIRAAGYRPSAADVNLHSRYILVLLIE